MKQLNKLMQEVIDLTSIIETQYPEIYRYMNETPLTIGKHPEKEISTEDLKDYLQTLKAQLKEHIQTHSKKQSQ